MRTYFMIWAWGLALAQGASGGSTGDGDGRTADAIFHNHIKWLGLGGNAAFWTRTRGRMGALIGRRVSFTRYRAYSTRASYSLQAPATAGIDFGCLPHTTLGTAGWST